jgi:hypothetical protein
MIQGVFAIPVAGLSLALSDNSSNWKTMVSMVRGIVGGTFSFVAAFLGSDDICG